MTTVTFDGVEFTKASEVAKKFGYTSDYVGQLCRGKKINARLVGRSWFVNIPSLEAHRENKYLKQRTAANKKSAIKKAPKTIEDTVAVKPTEPTSATLDISAKAAEIQPKINRRQVAAPKPAVHKIRVVERAVDDSLARAVHVAQYKTDAEALLPKVTKKQPKVKMLKVDMAEYESVRVKSSQRKPSNLKPTALPDVALSGSLKVSEISDEEFQVEDEKTVSSETDHRSKNKVISDKRSNEKGKDTDKSEALKNKSVAVVQQQAEAFDEMLLDQDSELFEIEDYDFDAEEIVEVRMINWSVVSLGVIVSILCAVGVLATAGLTISLDQFLVEELEISWSNLYKNMTILFTG